MAILENWFYGDDEPAADLTDAELEEAVALEREADDLERQARAWLLSQAEDGED